MNIHAAAKKLQTALCLQGRRVKINQFQSWSEKKRRMVTKFVISERKTVDGVTKDVAIMDTYQQSEVVKALVALLNSGGDG